MCGVSSFTCKFCRTTEQIEPMSTAGTLYKTHRAHLNRVFLNVIIVHPHAYTGLKTQLSLELVDPKSRLDQLLVIIWTPHKLRCRGCNKGISPHSEQNVLQFRSAHRRHIDRLRIQALVETIRGKIANQALDITGEDNSLGAQGDRLYARSEVGRASVLQNKTLCCEAVEILCFLCHEHLRNVDHYATEEFISQHQDHPSYLRYLVIISQLDEWLLAHTWMPVLQIRRYCTESNTFPIDTVIVRMKCTERGCDAAIPAPFQQEGILRFRNRHRAHLHRVGFEALVKGDRGGTFTCTLFEYHRKGDVHFETDFSAEASLEEQNC
jgi:hypothetical protein